jgi:hypothetical protein
MNEQPNVFICMALIAAGILFHFITKLAELEAQGQIISPWAYWRSKPYTSLIVVLGAYLCAAGSYYIGELTYVAALAIGVACNSMGDKLRARADKALSL